MLQKQIYITKKKKYLNFLPSKFKMDSNTSEPIKFYNLGDAYGEFSNFYHAEIEVDGKTWPTTEHYF